MPNKTKGALVKALKELLNETTLDHITVKEIVDRAGVSRQTFYYHFDDIYQMLDWAFQNALDQLFEMPAKDWHDRLTKEIAYLKENRVLAMNVYRSLGAEYFGKGLDRAMRPLIQEALQDVKYPISLDKEQEEVAISFFIYGASGMIIKWLHEEIPDHLEEMIDRIHNLLILHKNHKIFNDETPL